MPARSRVSALALLVLFVVTLAPPPAVAAPEGTLTIGLHVTLVSRWLDRYGFADAEAWARFDNSAAPLTLRANTLRITRGELAG